MHVLTIHLLSKALTELVKFLYNILLIDFKGLDLFLAGFDFLHCFSEFELIVKTLRFQVLFQYDLFFLFFELILDSLLKGVLVGS